ncbi:MAG TPA: DUF4127 family protein [Abditibacteriaceae bacterium]|jgi:hypothetical protein
MIALLSLDDRPCNVRFPQQIAEIGGDKIVVPPHHLLGRFNSAGEPEALIDWLFALPEVKGLILSVDMLAYGGLVASRRTDATLETALKRVSMLREWKKTRGVPILAFNILRRLAITMDGDANVDNYYNIMRWARLEDEAERFNSDHLRQQRDEVRRKIDPQLLQDYVDSRARNHKINGCMIDFLADDIFDYLLITQEDATEWGLHRQEQEALLAYAGERGVETKMSLHPGADEAALTLLARNWDTGVTFSVHPSNAADMQRIAPFEDRPYERALREHIAAMSGIWLEHGEDGIPDFHLFVNAPVGGSQKDEKPEARDERLRKLQPFIKELLQACAASEGGGVPVALCDVAFPNGADNALLNELEKRQALGQLTVFGGWNTAGNTTGTVLAQCAALKRSGDSARARHLSRQFTFERIVDDWYYQSQIREKIEKAARENGVSPLRMESAAAAPIEALARRELRAFSNLLAHRHFATTLGGTDVTLPWGRTFEADVRVKLI